MKYLIKYSKAGFNPAFKIQRKQEKIREKTRIRTRIGKYNTYIEKYKICQKYQKTVKLIRLNK